MKSRTKPALRALPAAQVQISLLVQGVLRDVRHAFLGLCIDAGQKVLAALMESDRIALCGAPEFDTKSRVRAIFSPRRRCNQQVSAAAPVFL